MLIWTTLRSILPDAEGCSVAVLMYLWHWIHLAQLTMIYYHSKYMLMLDNPIMFYSEYMHLKTVTPVNVCIKVIVSYTLCDIHLLILILDRLAFWQYAIQSEGIQWHILLHNYALM